MSETLSELGENFCLKLPFPVQFCTVFERKRAGSAEEVDNFGMRKNWRSKSKKKMKL